jgi:hypothetical protein
MEKYIGVQIENTRDDTITETVREMENRNPGYEFASFCGINSMILRLKDTAFNDVDPLSLLSNDELEYYRKYESRKNHDIKSTPENIINGIKSALIAVDAINMKNSNVIDRLLDVIVLTEIRLLINKNR